MSSEAIGVCLREKRIRVSDLKLTKGRVSTRREEEIVCRSVCVTKFKPIEQAVNKVQECH